MKRFLSFGLMLAAAPMMWAQGRTYGSPSGFGNILYPGMGTAPPNPAVRATQGTFASGLGGTISGRGIYGAPNGGQRGPGRGPVVIPYPVIVGGYGYNYATYPEQPPVTYLVQQPVQQQQPAPAVIINQNYTPDVARPAMREYTAPGAPVYDPQKQEEPAAAQQQKSVSVDDQKPTIYLLATNDGTVYSALAFWNEGGTLHYITTNHAHNRISMDLVDKKISQQLNQERGVDFRLK